MPTILYADDDADHRELVTIGLRRFGYELVQAANAPAALQVLEAGGIDAALLDVRMPAESGIDLCRRLRARPATARLPIMLVSAEACDERVTAAIEAGADDYLVKPFRRAELVARVDALLLRRGCPRARGAVSVMLASRSAGGLRVAPRPAVTRPAVAVPV